MATKRSTKLRFAANAAALLVAGGAVFLAIPRADAVSPGEVIGAVKTAYEIFQKLEGKKELTLEDATAQINDAIASARGDILAQIGRIAAADVEACARSAVINVADVASMSPDVKQDFAVNTTDCVTKAQSYIVSVDDKDSVDRMGYALNTVGPIALLARVHAGFGTAALHSALVDASNSLVKVLDPRCVGIPLRGDAEPGAPVEVLLRCTAFNGNVGTDSTFDRPRNGAPRPYDFTVAREIAMRGTSHELTVKVLPSLIG